MVWEIVKKVFKCDEIGKDATSNVQNNYSDVK